MLVCIPYCNRDKDRARALLQWIAELGNVSTHDVILFPDEGIDYAEDLRIAASCFRSAKVSPIDLCSTSKWPIGANHCWKRVVDYVDHFKLYPFLFLETDAIPLDPQWLNKLAAEFTQSGKRFMGYMEYAADPERAHMNGVGIYGDIYQYAPALMSAPTDDNGQNYMAFDWAGGKEVVPQMHVTKLIQFQYKKEAELLRDETLSWLKPEAVLFHTCKDLRIFDLLRNRSGATQDPNIKTIGGPRFEFTGNGPVRVHSVNDGKVIPTRGLTCDIFIKTYDKVRDWHAFALRSIDRYCTGFRKTVIVDHQPVESYQAMQVHKLTADLRTDADYILTTDSDTIFCHPVTPQTYMREGKTIWLHRTWDDAIAQEGDAVKRWRRGMTKFFGREPEFEFMCRHPEMIPRWLYSAFRIFCYERHGKTMEEWVLSDTDFADWNMLGYYAWLYHREAFFWINQSEVEPPPVTVKQYWGGHAPIEPHIPEMEAIIAGGVEVQHAPPGPVRRDPDLARHPDDLQEYLKERQQRKPRKSKKKRTLTPEHKAKLKAALARAREEKARKAVAV